MVHEMIKISKGNIDFFFYLCYYNNVLEKN